ELPAPGFSSLSLHDALPILKPRRASAAKAPRRQVPLRHRPREVASAHAVERQSGKSFVIAIALFVTAIQVVVAECAKKEIGERPDRKSTRLNSSHSQISYAV